MGSENRKRDKFIKARVSAAEKEQVEKNAADCSTSVGHLLRSLALGHRVNCTLDQQAILDLSKVNADQGRLGGLLKLWLTQDERFNSKKYNGDRLDIYMLLDKIKMNQERLAQILRSL